MLRYKVLLQLLLIMFLTMCLFVASYYFILRSYERVEANNLGLNRSRMLNALEQEVVRLDQINREWVDAGMMYALAQDPALVTFRNIVMEVIAGSFNVSHAAVFDADGNLLIGREANRFPASRSPIGARGTDAGRAEDGDDGPLRHRVGAELAQYCSSHVCLQVVVEIREGPGRGR